MIADYFFEFYVLAILLMLNVYKRHNLDRRFGLFLMCSGLALFLLFEAIYGFEGAISGVRIAAIAMILAKFIELPEVDKNH